MDIGSKLKNARLKNNLSQESLAEELNVSRQTISNWENGKTYPDIISIIRISELYSISLDNLLKGDENMLIHLKESTDVTRSNRIIAFAILLNILVGLTTFFLPEALVEREFYLIGVFLMAIISSGIIFNEIIKRF